MALFAANAGAVVQERPVLAINIPTIQFTNVSVVNGDGYRKIDVPWIGQYVSGVYSYAVAIAGVLAGVMFVIGGFQYLTAGGDASRVSKAKERIRDAVVGLLLAFGAYTILTTLNPSLVSFEALNVRTVARRTFTAEEREDYGDNTNPPVGGVASTNSPPVAGGAGAQAVCTTIESCRTMCNGTHPTSTPGVMDASLARPIPTLPGLVGGGQSASQAVIDGLTRAAADAHARGLTIVAASGYRPLATQIALVCARMGDPAREAGIGSAVAWPGGSNHGAGYAVDIQLREDSSGRTLVGSGNCAAQAAGTLATPANSQLFDQIMTAAGARRYSNEIWHYEFGSSSGCRCTYPNCPPPPKACSGC
ncbi:MAG TPA: D-alanyl-D-alanine carboxypeptidase family protein [Candidatus Binatia bacterium]|nr:D-alanyl-D-alanine carboxypeptidase family protein [Candidatus Binatia bacterium]